MQRTEVNEHCALKEFGCTRGGPTVEPTEWDVTVLLCKVTRAEVQFCIRLSQQIGSLSPAVRLCCPKVSCQLDEPDKST